MERCVPIADADRWLEAAVELARQAGALVREEFARAPREARRKAAADFVTATDLRSEELLVREIRARFPSHHILAEESGAHASTDGVRWVVDPLDGTSNFLHHIPHFAVLLAVQTRAGDAWQTEVGVIHDPMRDDLYCARRGDGATWNGAPIRVSRTARLEDGLYGTGFPSDRIERDVEATNHREFCAVNLVSHGVRRYCSAGLDLAYVACGRFEGFWEPRLGAWDVAGGGLLVEEAGGRFSRGDGTPVEFGDRWHDDLVVASNGRVHEPLLAMLAEARRRPV